MSFRAELEGPRNRPYYDKGGHFLRGVMRKALRAFERDGRVPIHKGELWL